MRNSYTATEGSEWDKHNDVCVDERKMDGMREVGMMVMIELSSLQLSDENRLKSSDERVNVLQKLYNKQE